MLSGPIDFVQKFKYRSASLTILLYRLFTLLSTDGDNNNASVIMELFLLRSNARIIYKIKTCIKVYLHYATSSQHTAKTTQKNNDNRYSTLRHQTTSKAAAAAAAATVLYKPKLGQPAVK